MAEVPAISAHRPIVPVRLDFGGRQWAIYAIVDSGADHCLFPIFIVPLLGMNIQNARVSMFAGAGSVNQVSLSFDNIGMTIGTIPRFETVVSFSAAMNAQGLGLLGQQGFFSRFKVDFDLPSGFFYIEDPAPTGSSALNP